MLYMGKEQGTVLEVGRGKQKENSYPGVRSKVRNQSRLKLGPDVWMGCGGGHKCVLNPGKSLSKGLAVAPWSGSLRMSLVGLVVSHQKGCGGNQSCNAGSG